MMDEDVIFEAYGTSSEGPFRVVDAEDYLEVKAQLTQANATIDKLVEAGELAAMHWSDAQSGYQSDELMAFRDAIEETKQLQESKS